MESQTIQETIKKSKLAAKDIYDYKWITYPESYLLPAVLREEKEELHIAWQTEGRIPVTEIRQEDILLRLLVMDSVGGLFMGRRKFSFSLAPENLYYDIHGTVQVKRRDLHTEERPETEKDFLEEYKALIGFSMQEELGYGEFRKGGLQLLGRDGLCGAIRDRESIAEIQVCIREKYQRIREERRNQKILLPKKKYLAVKRSAIILGTLLLILSGFMGYHFIVEEPCQRAVIKLGDAYVQSDYVSCIDAMQGISVQKMNLYQKYMLANAYVRSEDLTREQKNNILSSMTLKNSPSRLEYWIYLGRKDTEKAEDIALRLSDDQLLLYAYMKEKGNIENNTDLSGTEKAERLNEVEKKMQPLMDEYNTEGK